MDYDEEDIEKLAKRYERDKTQPFSADEYDSIIYYYMNHDTEQSDLLALETCNMALEIYPTSIDLKLDSFYINFKLKNKDALPRIIGEVDLLGCDRNTLLFLKGQYACVFDKNIESAEKYFDEQLELSESESDKIKMLSDIIHFLDDNREKELAMKYVKIVTECEYTDYSDPDVEDLMFSCVLILMSLFKYDEALMLCKRVVKTNPKNAFFWDKIGDMQMLKRNYDEALNAIDSVIAIGGRNPILYMNRASCLFNLDRYDEAIESYKKLLTGIIPGFPTVIGQKGVFNEMVDNILYVDEKNTYTRHRNRKPKFESNPFCYLCIEIYMGLGNCYIHKQDYVNAYETYNFLLHNLHVEFPDVYYNLGLLYSLSSKFAKAAKMVEKAITVLADPNCDEYHLYNLLYAKILFCQKKIEQSQELAQKLIKKQSAKYLVDENIFYSELLMNTDGVGEAIKYMENLKNKEYNVAEYFYQLTFLYYKNNQMDKSCENFQIALSFDDLYLHSFFEQYPEIKRNPQIMSVYLTYKNKKK